MSKRITFTKGFTPVKEKVEKSFRYSRSCDNCEFYLKEKEDEEEVCQNPNVLPYDVCVEENRTFCSFWKYVKTKREE